MTSKFSHEVGYVCICAMHSSTCAEKKIVITDFPQKGVKKKKTQKSNCSTKLLDLTKPFHLQSQAGSQNYSLSLAHPPPLKKEWSVLGPLPCLQKGGMNDTFLQSGSGRQKQGGTALT